MARRIPWLLITVWLVTLTISTGCGAMGGAPPSNGEQAAPVPTAASLSTANPSLPTPTMSLSPVFPLVSPTAQPEAPPAVLEARTLTLEWPAVMRAGDGDVIRLTLEVDAGGDITPTVEFEGHVSTGQTIYIPDVYATHDVYAKARLDLAGVVVQPSETVSRSLGPGQSLVFYWSIRPAQAGRVRGVVWFYVVFVPLAGGPEREKAVAAFPVEIEVVSLLGLKAGSARILGAVGALISSILGVPFLEDMLRWVLKRFERR